MKVALDSLDDLSIRTSWVTLIMTYRTNHKAMLGHIHNVAYIKFTTILRLGAFVHYLYFVICFRTLSKTQGWTLLNWSIYGLGIINQNHSKTFWCMLLGRTLDYFHSQDIPGFTRVLCLKDIKWLPFSGFNQLQVVSSKQYVINLRNIISMLIFRHTQWSFETTHKPKWFYKI